jgi:hypothetical protein
MINTERRTNQIEDFIQLENKVDTLFTKVEALSYTLSGIHVGHHDYIEKTMQREARKEAFQNAVIEKTMIALLWSGVSGLGYMLWQGIQTHWRW